MLKTLINCHNSSKLDSNLNSQIYNLIFMYYRLHSYYYYFFLQIIILKHPQ